VTTGQHRPPTVVTHTAGVLPLATAVRRWGPTCRETGRTGQRV